MTNRLLSKRSSLSSAAQLFLCQRPCEGIGGIVDARLHDFLVVSLGLYRIAGLLVGLGEQRQNQWVVLVGFLQFCDRSLVVAGIKRHIAGEIRIEPRLLGIVGLVERGFSGGDVLLGFVGVAAAGGDSGLRVLPAEEPEILVGVGQV